MTASPGGMTGHVRDQLRGPLELVGGFFRMCVLTGKAVLRPFEWREFILQSWFLMRVAFLPTVAVSVPLTVLIIFTLNILLAEFGAADISARVPRSVLSPSSARWSPCSSSQVRARPPSAPTLAPVRSVRR